LTHCIMQKEKCGAGGISAYSSLSVALAFDWR
jgi:hypothetical protein